MTGPGTEELSALAARLVAGLTARGETVAVAESLTGGLVASTLVEVPGVSAVLRGAVVAYATDLKTALLDVDAALLARVGAVDADVAAAMAEGVRRRLSATYGLATTGVAGPDPQEGVLPGTVHVALVGPHGARGSALRLAGDRPAIRVAAVRAVLELLETAADLAGDREHRG